jgi:hypothetical protein
MTRPPPDLPPLPEACSCGTTQTRERERAPNDYRLYRVHTGDCPVRDECVGSWWPWPCEKCGGSGRGEGGRWVMR